ncbi:peptidoglycan-binding protein [Streptomyces sp. NPDC004111]|uniref:peptidoglycan-binding domain-containing protein n=1 Tax=Streptomyces sp. NPDC004111 TaxID=3364690 RepID=UPI0036A1AC97
MPRTTLRTATAATLTGLVLAGGVLTGTSASAAAADTAAREPVRVAAACAYYQGSKLTVYGQKGDRVSQVQCLLANRKYLKWSDLDGEFGARTLAAVKKFQKNHGLTADGKVGTKTWHALRYA